MQRNKHRIPHVIKTKKGSHQPSSFLFFDTETQDDKQSGDVDSQHHRLWFGCYWCFRYEGAKPTRQKRGVFHSADDFWKVVKSRLDKARPLYVMAHNLGFDLTSVDFWNTAEEQGFNATYYVLEDPPLMISGELDGCRVVFLDTFNYWKSSVSAMGDSLGIPKKDFARSILTLKDAIPYCHRDVEIIANQVVKLLDFLNDNDLGTFGISAASLSMNIYKARFMNHKIFVHDRNSVLMLERASYYGGLVLNYYVGEVTDRKLYHYDVNSLYPSVMRNLYPTKLVWSGNDVPLNFPMFADKILGFIATVDLSSAVVTYPKRHAKKMCEVVGRVTTTLAGLEFATAITNGHVKKIHCMAAYELAPIMLDYVDYFWALRKQYKEAGDKVNEQFVKLMMNSLYGKFGMLGHQWIDYHHSVLCTIYEYYGVEMPDIYADDDYVPSISGTCQAWNAKGLAKPINLRYVTGKMQIQVPTGEHSESFCAIASFVTSYARCKLRSLIAKAGLRQVYYCDTDSLFVTELGHKRLSQSGEVNPNELGKLKLEGTADYALFNGPKDYIFGEVCKLKGISKRAKLLDDGRYEQLQFEGIKSILKRGGEAYIEIKTIRKKLTRQYTKGDVAGNGWTSPFKLTDW